MPALTLLAEDEEFDPNTVTPGIWGFVLTFVVMLIVVLLVIDMVRRIRRVNYRAEVREQLEAEQLEAEQLEAEQLEAEQLEADVRDAEIGEADGQATDAAGDVPTEGDEPPAR
ncbi:hypothetical protein [Agromyces subbeticus]|uniref:hypothetical protein n=1 Tax=Agromyces subbeticus TaxID=293890 RepID=UPI0012EB34C6|nr:hypothetical protein [Agromyces subbeticus]